MYEHFCMSICQETTPDLFSMQVVSVMHVLVFAEIRRHLSHFCVELDVYMFLLPKQNGMLETKNIHNNKHWKKYHSSYSKPRTHSEQMIQGIAQVMFQINKYSLITLPVIFSFIYNFTVNNYCSIICSQYDFFFYSMHAFFPTRSAYN